MKGHGAKFGRKKEEAIVALLTQRNIEEAAKAAGIAPNTLLKWMKDAEFDSGVPRSTARHFFAIGRQAATGCPRGSNHSDEDLG